MRKTQALILRRRDLKERDKLLTVFTPDQGKISLRAIGAKKIDSKLGGHLEPFMLSDISIVPSKTISIVAGAHCQHTFTRLRSTVSGLHAAQYLMEVLDKLTLPAQPDPKIFTLMTSGLDTLNQQQPLIFFTVQSLVLQLVSLLGFEPQVFRCSECQLGLDQSTIFQIDNGGVVHGTCARPELPGIPLQDDTLKTLRFALRTPIPSVSNLRLSMPIWEQVNQCVDQLIDKHSSSVVRSRVFLGHLI